MNVATLVLVSAISLVGSPDVSQRGCMITKRCKSGGCQSRRRPHQSLAIRLRTKSSIAILLSLPLTKPTRQSRRAVKNPAHPIKIK